MELKFVFFYNIVSFAGYVGLFLTFYFHLSSMFVICNLQKIIDSDNKVKGQGHQMDNCCDRKSAIS